MLPAAADRAAHHDRDATSHREALRLSLPSVSARSAAHSARPRVSAVDNWARGRSRSEYRAPPEVQGRRRSGSWDAGCGSWDARREWRYVGGGSGRRGFAGHENYERHGGKAGNRHESIDDSLSDGHTVDHAAEHGRAASGARITRGRRSRGVGLQPLSHLSGPDLHMQAKMVRRDLAAYSNERDYERRTDFAAHETRYLHRGAESERILRAQMQNREKYGCREGEAWADGL